MDNRKLSARADVGGVAPVIRSTGSATAFLDRVIDLSKANWEVLFYVGLISIAILTRLMNLGPRALHHDESIHAYYSNLYAKGGGYNYDPTYHGAFLYHIVALGFFLFGTDDGMARFMPAIFGIVLVGTCWFLRPFIGRIGAVIAALLITISPSISYYSRSLRHDIFALTGTMVLFISILWFMRTHKARWVYIGALAFAIGFTSHELMYIIALIFVLFLVIAAFLPQRSNVPTFQRSNVEGNPVTSALQSLRQQRWTALGGILIFFGFFTLMYTNMLTKFAYTSETFRAKDVNGIPLAGSTAPTVPFFFSLFEGAIYWASQHGVARGNQPQWYYLMMMPIYEALALFAGLGTFLYMIIRAITGSPDRYSEADEADANVDGPTDEFGVALPSIYAMRGFALGFLGFWALGALISFSIAGERLPWLLMQTALPFSLLAAAGLGRLITNIEWRSVARSGGAFLGVAVILLFFSGIGFAKFLGNPFAGIGAMVFMVILGVALIALTRFLRNTWLLSLVAIILSTLFGVLVTKFLGGKRVGDDTVNTIQGTLLFLFTFGLLALIGWIAYKVLLDDRGQVRLGRPFAVVGMTFAVVLALYGVRSMALLNYRHGDVPVEMLVYTQTSPDVPLVAQRVLRLSRDQTAFDDRSKDDVTGGRSLQVGIDSDVEWPFDWYFRDMRHINYYPQGDPPPPNFYDWSKPQSGPLPPVLIVNDKTIDKQGFKDATGSGKYVSQKFVLRWWFPEEIYKSNDPVTGVQNGDLGKAVKWMFSNDFVPYLLYRNLGPYNLNSTDFYLYVRKDLAVKVGMPGTDLTMTGTTGATQQQQGNPNVAPVGMYDNWGQPASADRGKFNLPRGIAQDANGNFFVVDTANFRIQKFDKDGKWLAQVGSKGDGNGQFAPINDDSKDTGPSGIAVDKTGNVYVTDVWNHRVQKFDNNLTFVAKWGSFVNLSDPGAASDAQVDSKFYGPRGVAVGPDGNVYVTDTGNKRVLIFTPDGQFARKIDSAMSPTKKSPDYPFSKPGEMNEPIGLTVDNTGNVYVADSVNKRIQKWDSKGTFVTQWAIPDAGWDSGSYMEPFLSTDSAGNVYATAPTSKTVLKFNPSGQLIGQKKQKDALILKTPTGITVGSDGTVYVVDTSGNSVANLGMIP